MKILIFLFASGTILAGEFLNLTFDAPNLSGPLEQIFPGGPYRGASADLLPGWTVTANGSPVNEMVYSPPLITSVPPVTLRGNNATDSLTPLGLFSLQLTSPLPIQTELRISQRGTIPADAAGLRFFGSGYVQMFVNGELAGDSIFPVPVDVSRWAGQEVNLEFSLGAGASSELDIFGFTSVPEPSTWALLGLGAAALVWQFHGGRMRRI